MPGNRTAQNPHVRDGFPRLTPSGMKNTSTVATAPKKTNNNVGAVILALSGMVSRTWGKQPSSKSIACTIALEKAGVIRSVADQVKSGLTLTEQAYHIAELTAAVTLGRQFAAQSRAELTASTQVLIDALRHGSGQSSKIEKLLWCLWNDDHQVNLCDTLAGLDAKLAHAAVAMIAARAHLGGDANEMLRAIIVETGSNRDPDYGPGCSAHGFLRFPGPRRLRSRKAVWNANDREFLDRLAFGFHYLDLVVM